MTSASWTGFVCLVLVECSALPAVQGVQCAGCELRLNQSTLTNSDTQITSSTCLGYTEYLDCAFCVLAQTTDTRISAACVRGSLHSAEGLVQAPNCRYTTDMGRVLAAVCTCVEDNCTHNDGVYFQHQQAVHVPCYCNQEVGCEEGKCWAEYCYAVDYNGRIQRGCALDANMIMLYAALVNTCTSPALPIVPPVIQKGEHQAVKGSTLCICNEAWCNEGVQAVYIDTTNQRTRQHHRIRHKSQMRTPNLHEHNWDSCLSGFTYTMYHMIRALTASPDVYVTDGCVVPSKNTVFQIGRLMYLTPSLQYTLTLTLESQIPSESDSSHKEPTILHSNTKQRHTQQQTINELIPAPTSPEEIFLPTDAKYDDPETYYESHPSRHYGGPVANTDLLLEHSNEPQASELKSEVDSDEDKNSFRTQLKVHTADKYKNHAGGLINKDRQGPIGPGNDQEDSASSYRAGSLGVAGIMVLAFFVVFTIVISYVV